MKQSVRNFFFIIVLILSVLFMPAVMGAGVIDLMEEDDLTDTDGDDFSLFSNFKCILQTPRAVNRLTLGPPSRDKRAEHIHPNSVSFFSHYILQASFGFWGHFYSRTFVVHRVELTGLSSNRP